MVGQVDTVHIMLDGIDGKTMESLPTGEEMLGHGIKTLALLDGPLGKLQK